MPNPWTQLGRAHEPRNGRIHHLGSALMALSEDDERRVEGLVLAMTRELRDPPNQEKEDRIGVEIAILPEEERDFVPTALLRLLVREREGRLDDLDPSPERQLPPRRRGFFRWG